MVIVVMGGAGAGKTMIGRTLAAELGWRFVEGDDHQPRANIDRMRRGHPLDDRDRAGWLAALHAIAAAAIDCREDVVIACSALKERYREQLRAGVKGVRFVYLQGEPSLLRRRLATRTGHFAGEELLASQLADLEEPTNAITIDAAQDPEAIVSTIRYQLGL